MSQVGRKGARRLPQVSPPHVSIDAGQAPIGLPDPSRPATYKTVWYEIKELLRRIWQLEQSVNTEVINAVGRDYVIACTFNGVFADSQVFIRHQLRLAVQLAGDLANSNAILAVGSEPTNQIIINVQKSTNGGISFITLGTITFAAGASTTPTLATTGSAAITFAVGDILLVIGPATHDATAGNIGITLMATRTL